jgi:uncharacterized RDD family membrane protein YckC
VSLKCLVCGHVNTAETRICINCGSPLEAGASGVGGVEDEGDATMMLDARGLPGGGGQKPSPLGPKLQKPPTPVPIVARLEPPPPRQEAPPPPMEYKPMEEPPPPPKPSKRPVAPPAAGRPPAVAPPVEDKDPQEPASPRESRKEEKEKPKPIPMSAAAILGKDDDEDDAPATMGQRLASVAIDGLVAAILLGVLSVFVMSEDFFDKDFIGMLVDLRVSLVLWVLALTIYFGFMSSMAAGQTIGKKAVGIRVVNAEGFAEVNMGVGLGRGLLKAVAFLLFPIGILFLALCLLNPERRGLHDLMTGTKVIKS